MALSALAAKKAQPKDKDYKLFVERGLYLLVKTNGAKYWRMKYRFAGKEKTLSFGVYPEVTLAEAMNRLDAARRQLREETDPGLEKKKAKLTHQLENDATFETIAREWLNMKARKWAPRHTERVTRSLELDIFPGIGNIPITDIDSVLLRSVIDPIQRRGALDVAARVRQRCSSISDLAGDLIPGLPWSEPI